MPKGGPPNELYPCASFRARLLSSEECTELKNILLEDVQAGTANGDPPDSTL